MTVSTTVASSGPYFGNGATTAFPFSFRTMAADEVEVLVDGVVRTSGFTVSLAGSGGTVTFSPPPASGTKVFIRSKPDFTQDVSLALNGKFSAEVLDEVHDRSAIRDIALRADLARAIKMPLGLTAVDIDPAPGEVVGFDEDNNVTTFALTVMAAPGSSVTSLGALAAISGPASGQTAYVTESGREGLFQYSAADHSAHVTADAYQGLYVAPSSDTDGSSGAWVRIVAGRAYLASWFGFSTSNLSTNHLRLRSLEGLRPAGSTVILPAGDFTGFGASPTTDVPSWSITKPGTIRGQGYATFIENGAGVEEHMLAVNASNVIVEKFRLEGMLSADNADAPFAINVGTRYNSSATGAVVENVKIRDMWIGNCDEGIRVVNGGYPEAGDAVWYHPKGIEIHSNRFYEIGYQAISLWGRGIDVHDNWISTRAGGSISSGGAARPFECVFRLVGCSNSQVHDNFIEDGNGVPCFVITPSSENTPFNTAGAEFNDPRDLLLTNNRAKGAGYLAQVFGFSGTIVISGGWYQRDLDLTTEADGISLGGGGGEDAKRGQFIVEGVKFIGFTCLATVTELSTKRIRFDKVMVIGNARTAALANDGIVRVSHVGVLGYNGIATEPLRLLEVVDCDFLLRDSLYVNGVTVAGSTGMHIVVRRTVMPFGITNPVALSSGTGTSVNDDNDAHIAGMLAQYLSDSTGYSHSPRYSDNGPNGGGPALYNPAYPSADKIPTPIIED